MPSASFDFYDHYNDEKTCKQRTKTYNSTWKNYKEFNNWLDPSKKGSRYFYCKLCNCDYYGGLTAIKQHSLLKQHRKLVIVTEPSTVDILQLTEKNFNQEAGM